MFQAFYNLLRSLLVSNNRTWLFQIFSGVGIGVISIVGFESFIDYYKGRALSEFGSLGAVSGLLGLAGIDKAVSIIIGAYLASVYITTFAKGLRLIKR